MGNNLEFKAISPGTGAKKAFQSQEKGPGQEKGPDPFSLPDGAVNLASPNPLPNSEFMRQLREALGVKVGLPASRWMLEVGAFFMRTETELILKNRRVVPGRLLQAGFVFQFPEWRTAAQDLASDQKRGPNYLTNSSALFFWPHNIMILGEDGFSTEPFRPFFLLELAE